MRTSRPDARLDVQAEAGASRFPERTRGVLGLGLLAFLGSVAIAGLLFAARGTRATERVLVVRPPMPPAVVTAPNDDGAKASRATGELAAAAASCNTTAPAGSEWIPAASSTTSPATAASAPFIPGNKAELVLPPSAAGHRVYLDGRVIGEGAGPLRADCGPHTMRVGSGGKERQVTLPCGERVEFK